MLRVNVGVSRKLSKDYNSTGFTLNLEGEIAAPMDDPEAVIERIREFYDLADEALNDQIARHDEVDRQARRETDPEERRSNESSNGNGRQTENGYRGRNGRNGSNGHHAGNDGGRDGPGSANRNGHSDELATNRQVQYLLTIAKSQNLSTAALEGEIERILQRKAGLYGMSKREAGVVIDAFTKASR